MADCLLKLVDHQSLTILLYESVTYHVMEIIFYYGMHLFQVQFEQIEFQLFLLCDLGNRRPKMRSSSIFDHRSWDKQTLSLMAIIRTLNTDCLNYRNS